jgi:hypothetical protein
MRRHLATSAAVLSAAVGTFGATAGVALAAGSEAAKPTTTATTTSATTTPTTPTTPTPTPTPAPAPVKASIRLYLLDAFFVHRKADTVPGRLMHVSGIVRPYVAGQWVVVKAYVGKKLIKSDRLRIKPSRNRRYGAFTEKVKSPRTGIVRVKVTHKRTRQMLGFLSVRGVNSLSPHAGFGSRGAFVALIQQRLAALHLYIPQTGVYDQKTGLALDAYHRLLGWGTYQSLDGATISAILDGRGAFRVRYPHDGAHVEGNLSKQLLALVNGSKVYAIYPISSGKPSTPTVLGHFRVYQRTPGYLPDGMYYSNFFYGGYAIHGYDPAPDYPASHGCMRLPIVDALSVFHWLANGDVVDVYQ